MCALTRQPDQPSAPDNVDIIEHNVFPSTSQQASEKIILKKAGRHKDNVDELEHIDIKVLNSMNMNNNNHSRQKLQLRRRSSEEVSSDEEDWKLNSKSQSMQNFKNDNQTRGSVSMAVNLSLIVNILLLFSKIIVFIMTWSLAVIASLVDSVLDLLSQLIICLTEKKVNIPGDIKGKYPVGKTRLEPVGILTVSVLMIMLSVTVIREAIQTLIEQSHGVDWSITAVIVLGGM